MRSLLFCSCFLGSILSLGNPPSQKHAKTGGSSATSRAHRIAIHSEKVVEGKAFLIQSSLPNPEEQLDLRSFLTHDVRGRELLYYLLHSRGNQSVYFVLSNAHSTQNGHREFALKKSLITQCIQQAQGRDLMTALSYRYRPDLNHREINIKELPEEEALIVIISNTDLLEPETKNSAKKDVILKTGPVSKNLFSIHLDSEFLRGGPRYAH
ncbi:MAG TPA: hypothetical protein VIU12_13400 [Chryseolinea sp.]